MSTASDVSGMLRRVLAQPTRGVVGLVEDLLAACREHDLQIEWHAERCRVRSKGGDWEEWIAVPIRKSIFRAILARFAALCNERTPNTVSPYGGQGEVSAGQNPPAVFRVTFTNTPAEQKLELTMLGANPDRDGRSLDANANQRRPTA